jgi:hypothetical protein
MDNRIVTIAAKAALLNMNILEHLLLSQNGFSTKRHEK